MPTEDDHLELIENIEEENWSSIFNPEVIDDFQTAFAS
jgi:hypothetical protein